MLNYRKSFSVEKHEALLDESRSDFFALNDDVKRYLISNGYVNKSVDCSYIDYAKSLPTNKQLKKLLIKVCNTEFIHYNNKKMDKCDKSCDIIYDDSNVNKLYDTSLYFTWGKYYKVY